MFFAYYAVGLLTATISVAIHTRKATERHERMYLLIAALTLAFMGSIMAGLQAGSAPTWKPLDTIPYVRLTYSLSTTLLIIQCLIYLNHLRKEP